MKKFALVVAVLSMLIISASASAEPLGYPWITYGEVSQTINNPDYEEGAILDVYAEQGVDWCNIGESDWILNTYAGVGLNLSDHDDDWWNNEVVPRLGIEVHRPFSTKSIHWGDVAVGLRVEYHSYFGTNRPVDDDTRAVVYCQWSFGGDWKKQ